MKQIESPYQNYSKPLDEKVSEKDWNFVRRDYLYSIVKVIIYTLLAVIGLTLMLWFVIDKKPTNSLIDLLLLVILYNAIFLGMAGFFVFMILAVIFEVIELMVIQQKYKISYEKKLEEIQNRIIETSKINTKKEWISPTNYFWVILFLFISPFTLYILLIWLVFPIKNYDQCLLICTISVFPTFLYYLFFWGRNYINKPYQLYLDSYIQPINITNAVPIIPQEQNKANPIYRKEIEEKPIIEEIKPLLTTIIPTIPTIHYGLEVSYNQEENIPRNFIGRKIDMIELNRAKAEIGLAGELAILAYEYDKLQKLGLNDLAEKIEHVAKTQGDSTGYDILSFTPTGQPMYIEVKSTTRTIQSPVIFSDNEVDFMKSQTEYYLYRIYEFDMEARLGKLIILKGYNEIFSFFDMQPMEYKAYPKQRGARIV